MKYLKKVFVILILINAFSLNRSDAQNTFFYYYDTLPSLTHAANYESVFTVTCPDGNYIGIGMNYSLGSMIYKMDTSGNMFWWKELSFSFQCAPLEIDVLADSSLGILFTTFDTIHSAIIMKMDFNGNILWTKGLSISSPASFSTLASTSDGGMLLSGGACVGKDLIIHIDPNGNIQSQHSHNIPSGLPVTVCSIIHDGNNQFSACGFGPSSLGIGMSFVFLKTDSAGNVYNYSEYYIPDGFYYDGLTWKNYIAKSSDGGHYCVFPVFGYKKFAVLFFNNQDQLLWSKFVGTPDTTEIGSGIGPTCVLATPDSGCLILANNIFISAPPTQKILTLALKFDRFGNINWTKMPGDTISPGSMKNVTISTISATADNGWIILVNGETQGRFNVCKTDSIMNGFCNYTSFNPIIVDFTPQVYSYPVSAFNINFTEDSINATVTSIPVYRKDVCSPLGINNVIEERNQLNLFPNPATSLFYISIDSKTTQSFEIYLYNPLGAQVYFSKEQTIAGKFSKEINVESLSNGIYFLELKTKEGVLNKKVVVQH